jgi:AcrR family transcriptional regulator
MRRIATVVGMTPMAIYKHYADVDALLNFALPPFDRASD